MRKIIRARLLLAAVAVFALTAGVTAAGASASEFTFSKTGALKGSALSNPHFSTAAGAWECKAEKASGTVTTLKTATQKVTVQYEKCTYFGLALTVTPAEYELNTNGTVKLLKAYTMHGTGCTITFPIQTDSTMKYANKPAGKIELESHLTNVVTVGTGTLCEYAEEKTGAQTGKSSLELEGGTAEVI